MSRELRSDMVSSVDRSNSCVADEQSVSQLQRDRPSTASMAMMSDAVPVAAEANLVDGAVIDEPGSMSNESSSMTCEPESSSGVSNEYTLAVISD